MGICRRRTRAAATPHPTTTSPIATLRSSCTGTATSSRSRSVRLTGIHCGFGAAYLAKQHWCTAIARSTYKQPNSSPSPPRDAEPGLGVSTGTLLEQFLAMRVVDHDEYFIPSPLQPTSRLPPSRPPSTSVEHTCTHIYPSSITPPWLEAFLIPYMPQKRSAIL